MVEPVAPFEAQNGPPASVRHGRLRPQRVVPRYYNVRPCRDRVGTNVTTGVVVV